MLENTIRWMGRREGGGEREGEGEMGKMGKREGWEGRNGGREGGGEGRIQLTCHGQVPSHSSVAIPHHSRHDRQKRQTWEQEHDTVLSNPQTDTVSLSVTFPFSGTEIRQKIETTSDKTQQSTQVRKFTTTLLATEMILVV